MNDGKEKPSLAQKYEKTEASKSVTDQLEKLNNKPELDIELSPRDIEARVEKARTEALHSAISSETKGKDAEKIIKKSSLKNRDSISKKQRNESYDKTIKQVQSELPIGSRMFSKITHLKAIERTSDIIGNTLARPNAMLAGAFFAFILTLLVYVIAKTSGYVLSGFETIAAFIIGWLLGLAYDYLKIMITGRKS